MAGLKRKLYDRLKQGCFRLGYRPGEDLLRQKHISKPMEDGDGSQSVEPSETSTVTDRTSEILVFDEMEADEMCDGRFC